MKLTKKGYMPRLIDKAIEEKLEEFAKWKCIQCRYTNREILQEMFR